MRIRTFPIRSAALAIAVLLGGSGDPHAAGWAGVEPVQPTAPQAPPAGQGAPSVGPRPNVGPADRPLVDPVLVERGRRVYAVECVTCHGSQARGGEGGPSLVRSLLFLRDRRGTELGPFLKKGHPMQSGAASASLTADQVVDLSQFIRQRLNDTLRGSPVFKEGDVRTGNAADGATYFNGPGGCATCHSPTGDLAGIGARYAPIDLQQRLVFPPRGRGGARGGAAAPSRSAITVTLTPKVGAPMSGILVQEDDFFVTFRDATGATRVVRRVPELTVIKTDPLEKHQQLLDRITDKNIHDLVAYLETIK